MARFRLKTKAYLPVPGTEWEQVETDQQTGRRARKVFTVPLYMNPDDPLDCNYPGELIVSTKFDNNYPRDIVFEGPPIPDMEPLDPEAEKIYNEYMEKFGGQHPIESLQATGVTYSDVLLENMQKQMADMQSTQRLMLQEKQESAELIEMRKQMEAMRREMEGMKRAQHPQSKS